MHMDFRLSNKLRRILLSKIDHRVRSGEVHRELIGLLVHHHVSVEEDVMYEGVGDGFERGNRIEGVERVGGGSWECEEGAEGEAGDFAGFDGAGGLPAMADYSEGVRSVHDPRKGGQRIQVENRRPGKCR